MNVHLSGQFADEARAAVTAIVNKRGRVLKTALQHALTYKEGQATRTIVVVSSAVVPICAEVMISLALQNVPDPSKIDS